jgi:hypothetical protein
MHKCSGLRFKKPWLAFSGISDLHLTATSQSRRLTSMADELDAKTNP